MAPCWNKPVCWSWCSATHCIHWLHCTEAEMYKSVSSASEPPNPFLRHRMIKLVTTNNEILKSNLEKIRILFLQDLYSLNLVLFNNCNYNSLVTTKLKNLPASSDSLYRGSVSALHNVQDQVQLLLDARHAPLERALLLLDVIHVVSNCLQGRRAVAGIAECLF